MRPLLIAGLAVLTGCATRPGPNSISWNPVNAHPTGTPAPAVKEGQLLLFGRAVRSDRTYAAPVVVDCKLQPEQPSTNNIFYIDLVPGGQPPTELPSDYLGIKLIHGQGLYVSLTRGGQPTDLIKPIPVHADADGGYELAVEVRRDGLGVRVNGETANINQAIPFDEFRIELRTFPPPNSWHVTKFSIH